MKYLVAVATVVLLVLSHGALPPADQKSDALVNLAPFPPDQTLAARVNPNDPIIPEDIGRVGCDLGCDWKPKNLIDLKACITATGLETYLADFSLLTTCQTYTTLQLCNKVEECVWIPETKSPSVTPASCMPRKSALNPVGVISNLKPYPLFHKCWAQSTANAEGCSAVDGGSACQLCDEVPSQYTPLTKVCLPANLIPSACSNLESSVVRERCLIPEVPLETIANVGCGYGSPYKPENGVQLGALGISTILKGKLAELTECLTYKTEEICEKSPNKKCVWFTPPRGWTDKFGTEQCVPNHIARFLYLTLRMFSKHVREISVPTYSDVATCFAQSDKGPTICAATPLASGKCGMCPENKEDSTKGNLMEGDSIEGGWKKFARRIPPMCIPESILSYACKEVKPKFDIPLESCYQWPVDVGEAGCEYGCIRKPKNMYQLVTCITQELATNTTNMVSRLTMLSSLVRRDDIDVAGTKLGKCLAKSSEGKAACEVEEYNKQECVWCHGIPDLNVPVCIPESIAGADKCSVLKREGPPELCPGMKIIRSNALPSVTLVSWMGALYMLLLLYI